MVRTLLHTPGSYASALGLPPGGRPVSLARWTAYSTREALARLSEMAREPGDTAEWGRDVLAKGLGVLLVASGEWRVARSYEPQRRRGAESIIMVLCASASLRFIT